MKMPDCSFFVDFSLPRAAAEAGATAAAVVAAVAAAIDLVALAPANRA